ncbi:MAG: DUF4249 domain-containing protein, partial [Muribaculaceae bacterium]|nr:DUF4249 domain-containing protein [Muribaculaceae bacterium]
ILNIIIAATFLLLLSSCEKDLDIKYHDIDPLTVIEAQLTPDGIKAGITLTTPMDEPMNLNRLTDATVILKDITTGESFALVADANGFYTSDVAGIAGHDYRLTVERNGEIHEAETKMYGTTEITGLEFNWIRMPYDHVAVLQGQFTETVGSDDYYWVKIYRNGEIYQWSQMSDKGAVNGIVTFVTMTSRMDTDEEDDDSVLYDGDVMTVTVSCISREMHDYLEALQNDSSGPAMFTGDKCLGYFIATSPASDTIVFHPDLIPVYKDAH